MQTTKPNAMSDIHAWLSYLENIHPKSIDMSLERVKTVATKMNLLNPAPYVFTVAGTNGKGTTCKALEMMLLAADFKVGVYSSPHLLRFTERVRINQQESTERNTINSFHAIESQRGNISLTYFEYATLSALYQFRQAKLDVVILEVGLGGRLDATNVIDADIAIITSIDIDHVNFLGNTKDSIGKEKAGIFKQHCTAVIGEPTVPDSVIQIAKQIGCPFYIVNEHWTYSNQDKKSWFFNAIGKKYQDLPIPNIPLANAATAVAALCYSSLHVPQSAIMAGLAKAQLTGRFQQIQNEPLVILDVAHNPHAAYYLQSQLNELIKEKSKKSKIRIVIGMLKDKDIKTTLSILSADAWYCATLYGDRGCDSTVLCEYLLNEGKQNVLSFNQVRKALDQALFDADNDDIIVVCGSFMTVSEVLKQPKYNVMLSSQ